MSGVGTLAATVTSGAAAAVTMTGAGTLTTTVLVREVAAITLAGTSTLSVTARQVITSAVTFTGVGTLEAGAIVQSGVVAPKHFRRVRWVSAHAPAPHVAAWAPVVYVD
jgi:hypothetical protein